MSRLAVATLFAAAALALSALAGCGGDGDATAGGGAASSRAAKRQAAYEKQRAAYVEEADGYCRRLVRRIRSELEPYASRAEGGSGAAARRLVAAMAPRVEFEIRRIRSLVLPTRDVQQVLAFLSAWDEEVEEAKRDPIAFVEAEQPFPEAVKLARRFGFEYCGTY